MYIIYYILLIVLTSFCIAKYCLPKDSLFSIIKKTVMFCSNISNLWLMFPTLIIVMFAFIENRFDNLIPNHDYTYLILNIEKNITPLLQKYNNLYLTYLLGFFYVIIWPSLITISFIVYNYYDDKKMINLLTLAYIGSYLIIFPFHIFFPICETWASNVGVNLLLNDINKDIVDWLRPLSGMKNCFPSFHTGLSWSIALVSFFSQEKRYDRLKVFLVISACLITYSTMYLGIHWIADVIAGIGVGYTFFYATKYVIQKDVHPKYIAKFKSLLVSDNV